MNHLKKTYGINSAGGGYRVEPEKYCHATLTVSTISQSLVVV